MTKSSGACPSQLVLVGGGRRSVISQKINFVHACSGVIQNARVENACMDFANKMIKNI
jgi:hypothetical protein